MKASKEKIQIVSYEELLGTSDNAAIRENVQELPIIQLHTFCNHPFQVVENEAMMELVQSVRQHGVLVPIIVRPRPTGGYEIVAGHRRVYASRKAEKEVVPAIVKDYSDDEAVVVMVDSNIQRLELLPSEKAFAYRMKYGALKRQGCRTDLNKNPVAKGMDTADVVGLEAGESGRTVQRFIRLTHLLSPLLGMADSKKINIGTAVEVSYLSQEQQTWLLEIMELENIFPSVTQAAAIKKYAEDNTLTKAVIEALLLKEKPVKGNVTLPTKNLGKFFPTEYTKEQIETIIYELLASWKQAQDDN